MYTTLRRGLPLFPASLLAAGLASSAAAYQITNDSPSIIGMSAHAEAAPSKGALDPKEFKPFKLIEREKLTYNTHRFRFELPNNQAAGLSVASCLMTRGPIKEKPTDEAPKVVVRPYTPVSPLGAQGYLDLVVKVYPEGKMSKYIDNLKVGDTLDIKGPFPKYPYQANVKKKIGMIAGGTGITPMLQIIDHIVANPDDKTEVSLVFANVGEDDIILKDKIDGIAAKHPNIKVHYLIEKTKWGGFLWRGGVGRVNKAVVAERMPPPGKDNLVMVCGPPGLMAAVSGDKAKDYSQGEVTGVLKELGYDSSMVYKF